MLPIRIAFDGLELKATLADTPTGQAIWAALPIASTVNTWGDEIYFSIRVNLDQEPAARELVQIGELGYWPPGSAFCIFFGKTPASRAPGEIRAASPVNVCGKLVAVSVEDLRAVRAGSSVRIEAAAE